MSWLKNGIQQAITLFRNNIALFTGLLLLDSISENIIPLIFPTDNSELWGIGDTFSILVGIFIYVPISLGAVTYALSMIYKDNQVTLIQSVMIGYKKIKDLFISSIYFLIYTIGVLIIPVLLFIFLSEAITNPVGIGLVITVSILLGGYGLFFLTRFSFYNFVVVLEDAKAKQALTRSEILTATYRTKIFILVLITYSVTFLSVFYFDDSQLMKNPITNLLFGIILSFIFLIERFIEFSFYWKVTQAMSGETQIDEH